MIQGKEGMWRYVHAYQRPWVVRGCFPSDVCKQSYSDSGEADAGERRDG